MTTETRKRIRAYKKALPELRERVIAVALLLAMSASMMGTASFAWITLSAAPEVTGMQTTVAANGNLEIALAQGLMTSGTVQPAESAIGDSSSTERENWGIVNANNTWGNLVNLSDPKYGLNRIALRPAMLSDFDLHISPLHGASYGADGRVIDTIQDYEYASLKQVGEDSYEFAAGDGVEYGVRAVASMRTDNLVGNNQIVIYETAVKKAYSDAAARYMALVSDGKEGSVQPTMIGDKTAVTALEKMVSTYAQDKVSKTDSSYDESIWYLHQMMIELKEILKLEGEGLLTMANWQAYITNGNTNHKTFDSLETLLTEYDKGTLSQYGVKLDTLRSFVTDYRKLDSLIIGMATMAEKCAPDKLDRPDIKWAQIDNEYINPLVDLSTATLEVPGKLTETRVYSIGLSVATDLLGVNNANIRVYDGIIKNTEARMLANQSRMDAAVAVTVKYGITVSVGGHVFTKVRENGTEPAYVNDYKYTKGLDNSGAGGQKYAKDTYGMAIDLWVRTNAENSILTLEGTTEYQYEDVTFVDDNNNTINIYELTIEQEDAQETIDVYQNPEDDKWYFYNNHEEVPEEYLTNGTREKKQRQIVVGYHGENRIWENWESLLELGYIAVDATTQGAGSAFVFYAATPTEQAKLLEMLRAFRITFINDVGTDIATAELDVDNAYINQGKVTAPLKITDGVTYFDDQGKPHTGIMELPLNKAVWLTAIIYLDGMLLKNENVLATNDIMGQLNLQFGNTVEMDVRNDDELQMEHRTITATAVSVANPNVQSSNSEEPITFDYNASGNEVAVTLSIDGEQAERISGFFVRVINETQGTRGDEVDFVKNDDGTWTGTFKLTAPGTYVMRNLLVNGIEYQLRGKTLVQKDNHPSVTIDGMTVDYVTTTHRSGTYMTSDPSIEVGVYAKITADVALNPKTVIAQFFNEDESKQYNARLQYNEGADGGRWEGTVSLNSSDTYYLRFLSIDGQIVEVNPNSQTRLVCYMGLKCRVDWTGIEVDGQINKDTNFLYEGKSFNLTMLATVVDDTNEPMQNLSGVHLYYHTDGSTDDDQGMHAPMEWIADKGYYRTTFEVVQPGTFRFDRLKVGDSSLTNALSSPTFVVSTPVPPSYVAGSATADEKQVVIHDPNSAEAVLTLDDAATAVVWAEMEKMTRNADGTYTATGETMMVQHSAKAKVSETDEKYQYTFVPNQDGIWKLKQVYCQAVYNGTTAYPYVGNPNSSNSYVIQIPTEDQVVTEVIRTVYAKLYYDGAEKTGSFTEVFGKDASGNKIGAAFYPNKNKELKVTITDYKGAAFAELTGVTWQITHSDANMNTYGGYTGDAYGKMQPKAMTLVSGKTTEYVAPEATFDLAGDYDSVITATFTMSDGTEYKYEFAAKPSFDVFSVTPTVAITGVTPATGSTYSVDAGEATKIGDDHSSENQGGYLRGQYRCYCITHENHKAGYSSSMTGTRATVYYKCSHTNDAKYGYTSWYGWLSGGLGAAEIAVLDNYQYHSYTQPTVTIKLENMGNATTATLAFKDSAGTAAHIYSSGGGKTKADYVWTQENWNANKSLTMYIGLFENSDRDDDTRTAAGTVTATVLKLKNSAGKEYTVDIADIAINNPY